MDGGPAALCVRTAHSLWSGGSDTPHTASVPGCLVPSRDYEDTSEGKPAQPRTRGPEQSTLITTSVSDSRVSLCLQNMSRSCSAHGWPLGLSRRRWWLVKLQTGPEGRGESGRVCLSRMKGRVCVGLSVSVSFPLSFSSSVRFSFS